MNERGRLRLLSAATLFYWGTMYIYVPILSPYLEDRGLSVAWIGFILGSYGLTQILVRLPLGIYSDAMSRRKPFLIAGLLAGALSCSFFLLPGTWGGPLAGRLVAGVCASAWVPFTVLYASCYPTDRTSQAMGTLSFLTVTGQLAGMLGSGWLTEASGYDATFRTGIALAAVGIAILLFVREPAAEPDTGVSRDGAGTAGAGSPIGAVFRSRWLWQVSILSLIAHGILFITMFGFTPLQAVKLGASGSELTGIAAAFMVPHAIVSLLTGRVLAPRFGPRPMILIGFVAAAIFTAAIPIFDSLAALAVTQAFNGAAQALYFPLLFGMAIRDFRPAQRATAMGLFQSVYSIGMFLGPYLAGALNAAGGLRAGFWFGGALGLSAVGLAAAFLRGSRQEPQHSG